MTAGRANQDAVRRQRHALAGGHQGHIPGRKQGMNLVLMLSLYVHDFPAAVLLQPYQVYAERPFAKLQENDLFRLIPAVDLLAAAQPNNV